MNIIAICPTYNRPMLMPNVLAMWNAQTFDAARRHLIILDDAGQFEKQSGYNWNLVSRCDRFPALSQKFANLLCLAHDECERRSWAAAETVVVVWEDDDVYLPTHCDRHVSVQKDGYLFSAPSVIWANDGVGPKNVHLSHATGRHHGAWAYRLSLAAQVGYGDKDFVDGAGFDLEFGSRLRKIADVGDTTKNGHPHYIYRWFSVPGSHNGSAYGTSMLTSQPAPNGRVPGKIIAAYDAETEHYYKTFS